MSLQTYVDVLNRSELVKTWKASGISAVVLATITFAALSMFGRPEWVADITIIVAGSGAALAKFAAELKRLGEGIEFPSHTGK